MESGSTAVALATAAVPQPSQANIEQSVRTLLEDSFGERLRAVDDLFTSYLCGFCASEPLGENGSALFSSIGPSFQAWGLTATEDESRDLCQRIADHLVQFSSSSPSAQEQLERQRAKISASQRKTTDQRLAQVQKALDAGKKTMLQPHKKKKDSKEPDEGDQKFVEPGTNTGRRPYNPDLMSDAVILKAPGADCSAPDEIRVTDFSLSFGGRQLLSNASFHFQRARKYGIIGRNGVGKSTLLRHLAKGAFQLAGNPDILYIEQEVPGNPASALEWVLGADKERANLLDAERRLLCNDEEAGLLGCGGAEPAAAAPKAAEQPTHEMLADVYARMEEISLDQMEARARMILSGFGFSQEEQDMPSNCFSGGWRMRISLARALFREPNFLLLDEPTNHLDIYGALWLESYLRRYQKCLIVVSHDRYFLNGVCTDIVHYNNEKLQFYHGNYDYFVGQREEQIKRDQRAYESQQMQIKHIQQFIDINRAKSEKKAKMAQSRMKTLAKMEIIQKVPDDEHAVTFRFPDLISQIKSPFLEMRDVSFAYTVGKPVLEHVTCQLGLRSKVACVGRNGAGKSTLLKIMSGELEASAGEMMRRSSLNIVRFSQHHVDEMDPSLDPISYLQGMVVSIPEFTGLRGVEKIRKHLGSFGITGTQGAQYLGSLSGGERMRVALAALTLNKNPHLVLLDEPTNHLDVAARDALIAALKSFQGAYLIVTHDQHLITSVCDELWVCEGKSVTLFTGTFEEYKARILRQLHVQ
ncbi:putative ABC transporter F family member 3 [Paratrimastix pyriformis]|uniref:ABC transporter F family member 3 n=1 Tax=Paratrimastix pyriformis TaxID=342808 RepID=A0ABQ8UMK5_9EUKA|nr:putative ABC transporter F family member 3 [Paratrimastix pyriformis]